MSTAGKRALGPGWRVWQWPLHWQISLGLLFGAALGLVLGAQAISDIPAGVAAAERGVVGGQLVRATALFAVVELLGDLFLRGLFLVTVPLITTSIVLAVARLGGQRDFGRLGLKTLVYYFTTSLAAVLLGLALVNLVAPGVGPGGGILEGQDLSAFSTAQAEVSRRVEGRRLADFLGVFRTMVPTNLVAAASEGNFLGLIVVSLFAGYFTSHLAPRLREPFQHVVEAVYEVTLMATQLVLKLAPLGILFLLARTVGEQLASLWPDGRFASFLTGIVSFAVVALVALLLHFFVTLPLLLLLVARANPLRHYRAMLPALLTAFSTASSAATLPLTLECVEKRAGVSGRVSGFTIPLGATVNMDGTALYECVAAVFICQAFGVQLSVVQQLTVVVVALLTSVGVAGVPSASLVAIAVILRTVEGQLPPEHAVSLVAGMGLLFVFDRPLDMVRTAVNVFGDSVGAVVVAKSEGEMRVLTDAVEPVANVGQP